MGKIPVVAAGLAALLLLAFLCAQHHRPDIERDLTTRAGVGLTEAGLATAGLARIELGAEGRDLTLTGTVPSEEARQTALDAARVHGVRTVIDRLTVGSAPSTPAAASASGETSSASGETEGTAASAGTWNLAGQRDPDGRLVWRGSLGPEAAGAVVSASPLWLGENGFRSELGEGAEPPGDEPDDARRAALLAALPFLGSVPGATLEASPDRLILSGQPDSVGQALTVRSTLADAVPEGMDLELRWTRAWSPEELVLQATGEDARWTLSGLVPDGTRGTWVGAAREAGLEPLRDYLIEADVTPPTGFGQAFEVALGDLARLERGRLVESAGRVEISGIADDPAAAGSLRERLASALPAGTELDVAVDRRLDQGQCQGRLVDLLSQEKIRFASGSARLEESSRRLLRDLASTLRRCPGLGISVEGHTDSDGTPRINQPLSRRRADAVVKRLVALGVDSTRLSSAGFGATRPIDEGTSAEAKRKNRRIELVLREGR